MKFIIHILFITLNLPAYADFNSHIEVISSSVEAKTVYTAEEPVEIFLRGIFPSSCFKPIGAQVSVNGNAVFLVDKALVYDAAVCTTALVPYTKSVNLGALPVGTYDVYVNEGGRYRQATRFQVADL